MITLGQPSDRLARDNQTSPKADLIKTHGLESHEPFVYNFVSSTIQALCAVIIVELGAHPYI